ncbi:TPA: DUF1983 domain-containing protein [Vibrio parahaemolyticus]
MPQAIPFAIAMVAGAVIAASMAPSLATSDYATKLNSSGSQTEIPVIYGETGGVGAHRIFKEIVSTSDGNDTATFIYTLGEGEIHAINQIYIDDLPLFATEKDYKNGTIGAGDISHHFRQHVQLQISTGSETSPFFFSMAKENSDGRWTDTDKLYGRAAICLKVKLDPWKGRIKNDGFKLSAKVKGKLIKDLRYESQPVGFQHTKPFGRNPALVVYDYLTNTRYGCGIDTLDIDEQSFIQAANWCDAHNLYCDGVVNQKQSYKKNLDALLSAFCGFLIDFNGTIFCVTDQPAASTFTFNADNVVGKTKIQYQAIEKYFNKLETTWFDPSKSYNQDTVCYPPRDDDPSIVADGKVITQRLELPFTKTKEALDLLSSKEVMKSKYSDVIEFTGNIDGFLCSVFDVITVDLPEQRINNRKFRIIEIKRNHNGNSAGTVNIKAVEYNSNVYSENWQGISRSVRPFDRTLKPATDLKFQFVEAGDSFTGLLTWEHRDARARQFHLFYKLSEQPDEGFTYYDTVTQKQCVVTGLSSNKYDFEVVAADLFGISSESIFVRDIDLRDDTIFPTVTGLKVDSAERDFVFSWDDMSGVELHTIDSALAISNKKVEAFFMAYEVVVKVNGTTVRTELVKDPSYTYTFDKNVTDGLSRAVSVEVRILGKAGAKSHTAALVTASNRQNPILSGVTIEAAPASLHISFDKPSDIDYVGTEIHMSKQRDFTPSPATLLKDFTNANFYTVIIDDDDTYFVRLASYDCFGRDNLVYTPAYQVSTQSAQSVLKEISSDSLSKDLLDVINGKADQSELTSVNADLQGSKRSLREYADERAAEVEAKADAASTKADTKAAEALQTARSELNTAKRQLQKAIDEKETDLTPVYSAIDTAQKASKDADNALTSKVNTAQAKANQNASNISSLQKTVADNQSATTTAIEQVKAETKTHANNAADAALLGSKAFTSAELTKERTARTSADSALSAQISKVKASADKASADISETKITLADTEQVLAKRISTLDSATSYSLAALNKKDANWDFKDGLRNWTQSSTIVHVTDPDEGDCMKLTSSQWPTNDFFIPVNPNRVYELSFRIKQQIVSGSKSSYLGVKCYDKDKKEISTSPRGADTKPYTGTYTYCGKGGGNTPEEWTTFSGKITGINGYSRNAFRPDTCFIKIMLIANYSGGKGEARVSWVNFEDVTERDETSARISTVEQTVSENESAQASRVTKLETKVSSNKTSSDAAIAKARKEAADEAKRKADEALLLAKAYTTNKSNAAKQAAINEAQKKADKAEADAIKAAKSYADTKAYEERQYTSAKFDEAVSLVNSKDSATAAKISNLESVTNNVKTSGFANKQTITVGGDSDKYYPVYFKGGNQNLARRIVVSRNYSEYGPNDWHTKTHKGALLLDLTANFGGWGGQTYSWNINKIQQQYTTLFAGANNAVYQMYFCIWLRGGGAVYHVYQEVNCPIHVGTNTGELLYRSAQSHATYEQFVVAPRRQAWTTEEINARLVGKKEYAGLSKVENLSPDEIREPVRQEVTAKINEVKKTLTDNDTAMARRVTQMEASVTSDSLAKANNAEQRAKSHADSVAKSKADKALADAKAHTNSKTTEANNYTNSKYNEAVNLINSKNSAMASRVTSMETSLKSDSQSRANKAKADAITAAKADAQNKANEARDAAIKALEKRGNLLEKYFANWKVGMHPSDCGWGQNGHSNENRFIVDSDPFCTRSTIWEMNTNSSSTSDADGGISAARFKCDSKKTYRFSIYAKTTASSGTTYLGCQGNHTQNLSGSNISNPYFWTGDLPEQNKWFLIVGVLHHDAATTESGIAGVYDPETGRKILDGSEFRIRAGYGDQLLRAYHYYSKTPSTKQYFWMPRVDEVNGNEPPLSALMANVGANAYNKAEEAVTHTNSKFNEAVNLINSKAGANASKITTVEATAKTARSKAGTAQATANTATSKAEQAIRTAASIDGKVESMYTLRLTSNKKVAGFGLSNDGSTSAFSVQADKFLIYDGKSDVAAFAVKNGKLVVQEALIDNLSGSKIAAGSIKADKLEARLIKANSALIDDGAITNGKIGNVIESISYAEDSKGIPTSGWHINKDGVIKCKNLVGSGTLYGSRIMGSIIEGAYFVTNSNVNTPVVPTEADTGKGTRYLASSNYSVTRSAGGRTAAKNVWTDYQSIATYNYTAEGSERFESTTLYKNTNRYPKRYIAPRIKATCYIDKPTIPSRGYPYECRKVSATIALDASGGHRIKTYQFTIDTGASIAKKVSGNRYQYGSRNQTHGVNPGAAPNTKVVNVALARGVIARCTITYAWAIKVDFTQQGGCGGGFYTGYCRSYPRSIEIEVVHSNGMRDIDYSGNRSAIRAFAGFEAPNAGEHAWVWFEDNTGRYL